MAKSPKFPNLASEMARAGYGAKEIASALGCSRYSVYSRLRGEAQTSVAEAAKVRDELFPGMTIDYLFDERG